MNKEQDAFQETSKTEEDLLNFEFDELSEEKGAQGADGPAELGDEAIIELTDVIEEGEPVAAGESDDTLRLDDIDELSEAVLEPEELLGEDIEGILEEDVSGELDLDLDSVLEPIGELEEEALPPSEKESEIELMDVQEETLEAQLDLGEGEALAEAPEVIAVEGTLRTETESRDEISLDFELESGAEPLSEEVVPPEATGIKIPDEDLSAPVPEPDKGLAAMTPEALESAVTNAVADVLDRSVSQSIDSAAERVLTEKLGSIVPGLIQDAVKASTETTLRAAIEETVTSRLAATLPSLVEGAVGTAVQASVASAVERFAAEKVAVFPSLIQDAVSGVMPDTVRSALTETLSGRLEAIIPGALEDIVKRSVEGTVAAVAERVISEKIAALLPGLVEQTIGRVAQETMLSVAEKVITEEIASLRKALESEAT